MMLNTIVHINDHVAKGLQEKVKEFTKKQLTSYAGKHVESARVELMAICTRLDEHKMLPADSVNNVIEGLRKCSHVGVSSTFTEFIQARKNSLMGNVSLSGTVMEQIQTVLDEADDQYTTLVLSNQWVRAGMSTHLAGAVCDNCGGDHLSPNYTQPHNEAKIVRNRAASIACNGGQDRHGGCRPYGGPGHGNGGGNSCGYQLGKLASPKPNKIVHTIEGKVYCAYKEYRWNHGDDAHNTGGHTAYLANSYVCPPAPKAEIKRAKTGRKQRTKAPKYDDNDDEKTPAGAFSFTLDQVSVYGKATANIDACAWAGQFAAFLKNVPKSRTMLVSWNSIHPTLRSSSSFILHLGVICFCGTPNL